MTNPLYRTYIHFRATFPRISAAGALTLARTPAGTCPRQMLWTGLGQKPAAEGGTRWVESWRELFAGLTLSDDVCRHLRHTGWFTDDGCYGTLRGCAVKLRGGRGFLAGYCEFEGRKETNPGSVRVETDTIYDCERDAALAGDGFAEREAEKEREWREVWQAGQDYREWHDRRATLYADLQSVNVALSGLAPGASVAREVLRGEIDRLAAEYEELHEKIELAKAKPARWRKELAAAFNEGADEEVFAG